MIEKLKSFSPTKYSLEELIDLSAYQRVISIEYGIVGIDAPEWLSESGRRLSTAIKERVIDQIDLKLKNAMAKRSNLKTADERRKELDEEIAALTAKLA